ncbi:MAG: UDP-2,3-diacylglucosamine diphosphatase LpxI domain-containing protein [Planctomycetota bacterium]
MVLEGISGSLLPSREQRGDIEFGWPLLQQIVELGIGGTMAVRERDVIAVEATEGTLSLIERAGALCRARGWVLLMTSGPQQDPGSPGPSIDVELIEALVAAGGGCLALGAGCTVLTDEARVLEAAGRAKIAVVTVAEPAE